MGKKVKVHRNKFKYRYIPYLHCFEEGGMIETEFGTFSRCYQFTLPEKQPGNYFSSKQARAAMEEILRGLAEHFTFQFTLCSSHMDQEDFLRSVELKTDPEEDGYQGIRESYNAVLRDNCGIGHNNFTRRVYLTISVEADTPEDAFAVFEESDLRIRKLFASLYGYGAETMDLAGRLELLYGIYHPEMEAMGSGSKVDYDGRGFSIESMQRMGMSTKEVVVPEYYGSRERNYLRVGGSYVRLFFISSFAANVPDSIIHDLADASAHSLVSIHCEPMDARLGLRTVEKLVRENTAVREVPVRDTVVGRKERRTRKQEEWKRDTEQEAFYRAALGVFRHACAREEPVMQVSVLAALYAEGQEELERDSERLKVSAAKYACQVRCLDLQQDAAFQSVLPLGNMKVDVKRVLPLASWRPCSLSGSRGL